MAIAKKPKPQQAGAPATGTDKERAAEAFISKAGTGAALQEPEAESEGRKVPVTMRYDPDILKRADAAAKRLGISRSAYVHIALSRILEQEP